MKPLNRRSFLARGAVLTGAAGAALATGAHAADLPDTPTGPPTTPGGSPGEGDLGRQWFRYGPWRATTEPWPG